MLGLFLTACGEEDSGSKDTKNIETKSSEQAPEQIATDENRIELTNGVIYQEAIYKNWPYTEAAVATVSEEIIEEVEVPAETTVEKTVATNSVTHKINAQARIFKPDTIYINPGDVVQWVNMTSHNTASVEGLIPEGAKHWQSKLGENLKIKLDVVGIYAYVCQPHIGFGMVGVIVVGKPTNLDEVMAFATTKLEGPYRRLIGKLKKVKIP
jgi:pseudoazurin